MSVIVWGHWLANLINHLSLEESAGQLEVALHLYTATENFLRNGRAEEVVISIPVDPLYLSVLVSAEKK